jgi:hypothetical protein
MILLCLPDGAVVKRTVQAMVSSLQPGRRRGEAFSEEDI